MVVLCVNVRDEPDVIVDYWIEKDFGMTPVRLPLKDAATAFGVKGFPSNIVIGPDGKVRFSEQGFTAPLLRKALAATN